MTRLRATTAMAVLSMATVALAGGKRSTGMVHDNLYRDGVYGFTLQKYDNWKFGKIDAEDPAKPRARRCILTQRNVQVPIDYLGNEEKFTPPKIGVFVDTSAMALEEYAAELAERKSKLTARKELMADFSILSRGQYVQQEPFMLDGDSAIVQHYRQDYEVQLYNRTKDQYSLKEDAILGDLYVTKRGGTVYIVHLACERAIYRMVNEEAKAIIMSVDFDPPADSLSGMGSGTPAE